MNPRTCRHKALWFFTQGSRPRRIMQHHSGEPLFLPMGLYSTRTVAGTLCAAVVSSIRKTLRYQPPRVGSLFLRSELTARGNGCCAPAKRGRSTACGCLVYQRLSLRSHLYVCHGSRSLFAPPLWLRVPCAFSSLMLLLFGLGHYHPRILTSFTSQFLKFQNLKRGFITCANLNCSPHSMPERCGHLLGT